LFCVPLFLCKKRLFPLISAAEEKVTSYITYSPCQQLYQGPGRDLAVEDHFLGVIPEDGAQEKVEAMYIDL